MNFEVLKIQDDANFWDDGDDDDDDDIWHVATSDNIP